MTARTELPGLGKAASCQLGSPARAHVARRFVWHHILPQVCGGKTEAANLAQVCDSCHYSVHSLMYLMAQGTPSPAKPYTKAQLALARQGYAAAVAAGTAAQMPEEG